MKYRIGSLLLTFLLVLTSSCRKQEEDDLLQNLVLLNLFASASSGGLRASLNIDLSTSKGLLVGSSSNAFVAGRATAGTTYNINASGNLEVTQLFSGDSSTTSTFTPGLIKSTTNFVVFVFFAQAGLGSPPCRMVLARRSDNALFCGDTTTAPVSFFGNVVGDYQNPTFNPIVQTDAAENIYVSMRSRDDGNNFSDIYKIDTSNPSAPTIQKVVDTSSTGESGVYSFAVNPTTGDIFYGSNNVARIRTSVGGFQGIVSSGGQTYPVLGPDGNFYMAGSSTCKRLVKSGSTYNTSDFTCGTSNLRWQCKTSTRHFVISFSNTNIYKIVDGGAGVNVSTAVPSASTINDVKCSNNDIYIMATDGSANSFITRFNTGASNFTTLLTAGAYVLSAFDVASDGTITFSGLRNSDGNKVVGEVSGTGTVTITSASAPQVSQLVRIN